MTQVRRGGWIMVLAAALGAAGGCADKLRYEQSFSLPQDKGDPDKILLPPQQSSDQQVKVQVTATEPVDVFVFLGKNEAEIGDLSAADREKQALGSKRGVTSDILAVKVPKKQDYKVLISLADKSKKSDVKVKMTN